MTGHAAMDNAVSTARCRSDAIELAAFPWSRPLVNSYIAEFPKVSAFFAGDSAKQADWRSTIDRVRRSRADRGSVSPILARQLERRGAPAKAKVAAAILDDEATVAIVTGQQAGLFGGPLYTLLKAITAIQLARWVEAELGTPAVPVFWVEGDDHDWAEVRGAQFLDADLTLKSAVAKDPCGAGAQCVANLSLRDDDTALECLADGLPRTEFSEELLASLRRHYAPGRGCAEAFARWMDHLLGDHGLVVFEANDPAAKPLVADIFARELGHPGRTSELVRQRAASMRDLDYEPQLDPGDNAVSLFYLDADGRHAIRRQAVDTNARQPSVEALRAQALSHPERFSPNVVLRPIVQDRLFPTVCYVAGPSEMVYHGQLGDVYQECGVERPLVHPRLSATILDSATARFLTRHRLSLLDLHTDMDGVLRRLVEQELPPGIDDAFLAATDALAAHSSRLRQAVAQVDQTLAGAVDTTETRVREVFGTLQSKVIQAAKRKDETLRRQLSRAMSLVYPGETPQERGLSAVYFLNKYGPGLCEALLTLSPFPVGKHHVLHL